jgi:hypothetical protein
MLENLFIDAAKDLRKHGWTQPSGDTPLLFYHPEFGAHEFFKACYIYSNADRIKQRRKLMVRIRASIYSLIIGGLLLFTVYKLAETLL